MISIPVLYTYLLSIATQGDPQKACLFILSDPTCKLVQESYVILRVQTQVVYTIFQLADALHTHTEGETGVFVGVNTKVVQHFRMYHTAAKDLYPAGVLT